MLISAIVTLFVAIQDPIVQRFAVRFVGGYLSEKTGADIKVGRIAISPDFSVFVDDVIVKDLNDNELAKVGSLRAKIFVTDLLDGKLHLGHVQLRNTDANLIQYEGTNDFNFKFLADFFSSDKEKDPNKESMPIFVDRITLRNINFQFWNQNKADTTKTERHLMDYAHIDLDDINLEAKHFAMMGDSIYTVIEMLRANEICGMQLKHFQSDVVFCSQGVFLKDLQIETNNSLLHLDLDMNYHGTGAFSKFVDSVFFDATFYPSDVLLSDFGYFSDVMFEMPNRLQLQGKFSGPIAHFNFKDMSVDLGKMTSIRGDVAMHPLDFNDGYHVLNIKNLHFSYDDLTNFRIPGKSGGIPLPESLSALQDGDIRLNFKGSFNNFNADLALVSDIGNMNASVARSKQGEAASVFSGYVDADRIDVGHLANASKMIGQLDLKAGFEAKIPKNGDIELSMDGNAYRVELIGNHIDEIVLNGSMKEKRFNGRVDVDDDELQLAFNGMIDFHDKKHPKSDFEAAIRYADLHALHLLNEDSISEISTRAYVNLTGFSLDDLEGVLHIDSTLYRDSRGEYFMESFGASIVNDNLMQRRININCDFFDFEMAGKVNFANLMMSLNEYGNSFVRFPVMEQDIEDFQAYKLKHDVEQDFFFSLALKDPRTLTRLLMPSLQVANNTTVNGTFTSRSRMLNLTARTKKITMGDLTINNLELKNYNNRTANFGQLAIEDVVWSKMSESDTTNIKIDNLLLSAKMANDTIALQMKWDDVAEEDRNKGLIESVFVPHEEGGVFAIEKSEVVVNDSLWVTTPDNFIDFNQHGIEISNFMFSHNQQSLRINGKVPMLAGDTLSVQVNRFDISMLDFLTLSKGYNIDGFITGDAQVGSLKEAPMVFANLNIESLGLNGDYIGDMSVNSEWDNDNQSIKADVGIIRDNKRSLSLLGNYYTTRKDNNLDFNIKMDSLQLSIINMFVAGQASRVQGYGIGDISVSGSPKQLQLEGRLDIKDGGCKVSYLNTYYTFSPTILIDSKKIEFNDMVLTDTLGNKALIEGKINHNYLKDFQMDLKLHPHNFLVMATSLKDNDAFFGSVIVDGLVSVKGPINNIVLEAKAKTCSGTKLTLPLNTASKVSNNDFIVFVSSPEEEEEEEEEPVVKVKQKSKFAISLDVDVTDDAGVKMYLPADLGTIDATGHGNLKIGTSNSEALTLYGNYIINNGRFQLNLKNILLKNFTLQEGGTIEWSGSPTDGRINATGVYSVKAPLSSLDIQMDSTASSGNINVDCLIHLQDKLLNPTITFGIRLPNVTDDVRQTVFSVIDTTNQAIMSTQALSLLVLSSFAGNSNSPSFGSIANGFLSANMNLDVGLDLDLGVKYVTGNGIKSYDEMQFALKTELFENRLIIETNLGVLTDNNAQEQASNIIGEIDLYYKLFKDGRLMAHFYNHSNYSTYYSSLSFDRLAPYTQGLGLTYSKSFDSFRDIFKPKRTVVPNRPLLNKRNNNTP